MAATAAVVALVLSTASSGSVSAAGVRPEASSGHLVATSTDYCGTAGIDVPDQGPYFDFGSLCAAHDECYGTGGDEADRLVCDVAFLSAMRGSCDSMWPVRGLWDIAQLRNRRICHSYAQLYFAGVRLGGGESFNYSTSG